ncbi:MAG: hypothetical protein GY832_12185 [Chloroflexi bacterium]|nr:hypothetical protein [Chloroflexota bacterium]
MMETFKISVADYRGVRKAEIDVSGIALVAGTNAAGKTSVTQALAAALTGNATPLAGLRKSEAGALVRSGAADGSVTVASGDGVSQIRWPAAKMTTEGTPPQASAIAAGLDSVALMTPVERAKALMPYLKADPDKDDLVAALPDIKPEHIDKLWDSLEINGWDGAHGQAKDKGVNLKGRWEQATGERYGSKKAANWLPDDWGDELEATSEQTLQDGLSQEREFLEAAIAAHAISDDKRREMEEQADHIGEIAEKVTALDLEQQKIRSSIYAAREELRLMPYAGPPPIQTCPHCGEGLVVDGCKITRPPDNLPTQKEIDERKAEIADKEKEVKSLEAEHDHAYGKWKASEQELTAATRAKGELEKNPPPEGEYRDVEECRERVVRAEARLGAFLARREADRIHTDIGINQAVINVLAPDGLRARKLAEAVRSFHARHLAPLSKKAGWQEVTLDDDLRPTYGDRPYPLLSASEQYRVRAVLQLAMARLDGSDMVVLDAADILDRHGRNGLMKMLIDTDIPALVSMTITDPVKTPPPDLSASGRGITYWLEHGIAQPFGGWVEFNNE